MAPNRASTLGRYLRTYREENGIETATELAEKSGIRRSHLSEIENGKRSLTKANLARIAEAMGTSADDLNLRLREIAARDATAEGAQVPGNHAESSPQIREGPGLYGRRMTTKVPDAEALLRHVIGKMSREEQFQLLRELSDAGEAGDLSAVPKARALLEIIPVQPLTGPSGG